MRRAAPRRAPHICMLPRDIPVIIEANMPLDRRRTVRRGAAPGWEEGRNWFVSATTTREELLDRATGFHAAPPTTPPLVQR